MIGLDTNVIVRYLTQDDPKQSAIANKLIEKELSGERRGFVTLVTLVEVVWVLESCYAQSKGQIVRVVESLLAAKQLMIEHSAVARLATSRFRAGNADFSDAIISLTCEAAECERTVTFDRKAVSVGMQLL